MICFSDGGKKTTAALGLSQEKPFAAPQGTTMR